MTRCCCFLVPFKCRGALCVYSYAINGLMRIMWAHTEYEPDDNKAIVEARKSIFISSPAWKLLLRKCTEVGRKNRSPCFVARASTVARKWSEIGEFVDLLCGYITGRKLKMTVKRASEEFCCQKDEKYWLLICRKLQKLLENEGWISMLDRSICKLR